MARATEQINVWYERVEAGKLELHDTLRDRLSAAQRRTDQMTAELAAISKRRQLPLEKSLRNPEPRGAQTCIELVRLAGIEPTTLGFGGQYSIH